LTASLEIEISTANFLVIITNRECKDDYMQRARRPWVNNLINHELAGVTEIIAGCE